MRIVANYKHFKELNEEIQQAIKNGAAQLTLEDVNGQSFIANSLRGKLKIDIYGKSDRFWQRPRRRWKYHEFRQNCHPR
jgi:hypothetical protein